MTDELRPGVAEVPRTALRGDTTGLAVWATARLSQSAAPDAEAALLAALTVEPAAPVRHEIVAGLARVGGEDALDALSDLVRSEPELAGHAEFARSVIAHRVGLPGYDPPAVAEADVAAAPHGTRTVQALRAHGPIPDGSPLSGDTYGLTFGPSVPGVRCGARRLAVAVDLTALARLLTTPTVAAIVATAAEGDGTLHTSMLVLCRPTGDNAAHVAVHRTTGTPAFTGSAKVAGTSISFRLHAVRAPGARRATVTGTITAGVLDSVEVSFGTAPPEQAPEPM